MAIQYVENGKLVDKSAGATVGNKEASKNGSTLDKDAFLQLLVAQMKYQDPLEPTSNTEYVSQLATFTSLEEMQNLRSGMDMQRASSLVGSVVMVRADTESGYVSGKVDYIKVEAGKPYLVINETPYSLDSLDTVFEDEYLDAYTLAVDFLAAMNALPAADKLNLADHEEKVTKLKEIYDKMTDYQKSFIPKTVKEALDAAVKKIDELKAAQGGGDEEGEDGDEGSEGEGGGNVEGGA